MEQETREIKDYLEIHHNDSSPFAVERKVLIEKGEESTTFTIYKNGSKMFLTDRNNGNELKLLAEAMQKLLGAK